MKEKEYLFRWMEESLRAQNQWSRGRIPVKYVVSVGKVGFFRNFAFGNTRQGVEENAERRLFHFVQNISKRLIKKRKNLGSVQERYTILFSPPKGPKLSTF
jgi:predicted Zn-dependent protease